MSCTLTQQTINTDERTAIAVLVYLEQGTIEEERERKNGLKMQRFPAYILAPLQEKKEKQKSVHSSRSKKTHIWHYSFGFQCSNVK